VNHMLFLL